MAYEFGNVVLVGFPFRNQATFKQRPAAIVNSRADNVAKPDVVSVAITSQVFALQSGRSSTRPVAGGTKRVCENSGETANLWVSKSVPQRLNPSSTGDLRHG